MVGPDVLKKVRCRLCRQIDNCHSISMMLAVRWSQKNYLDIQIANIACSKLHVQAVFYYMCCM